jgi:hypothetical protein
MSSAADAMAVLAELLGGTTLSRMPNAAAIAFDLDGETWGLDPRRTPLVSEGLPAKPVTTVRCPPEVLLRLFTDEHFALRAGEQLTVIGDPSPLRVLADALSGGGSPITARLEAVRRKKK